MSLGYRPCRVGIRFKIRNRISFLPRHCSRLNLPPSLLFSPRHHSPPPSLCPSPTHRVHADDTPRQRRHRAQHPQHHQVTGQPAQHRVELGGASAGRRRPGPPRRRPPAPPRAAPLSSSAYAAEDIEGDIGLRGWRVGRGVRVSEELGDR